MAPLYTQILVRASAACPFDLNLKIMLKISALYIWIQMWHKQNKNLFSVNAKIWTWISQVAAKYTYNQSAWAFPYSITFWVKLKCRHVIPPYYYCYLRLHNENTFTHFSVSLMQTFFFLKTKSCCVLTQDVKVERKCL